MAIPTDIRTTDHSLTERFFASIEAAKVAMQRRRIYRTTVKELSALTDRDLCDLGIARGEIRSIAAMASENI